MFLQLHRAIPSRQLYPLLSQPHLVSPTQQVEMVMELLNARRLYLGIDNETVLEDYGWHNETHSLLNNVEHKYDGISSKWWPFHALHEELLSVEQYFALQIVSVTRNYNGIAQTQAENQKK